MKNFGGYTEFDSQIEGDGPAESARNSIRRHSTQ
jgi:hypothetical protein